MLTTFPCLVKMDARVHVFSTFTYLFLTIPSILMPIILHVQLHRGWAWIAYLYLFVFFSSSLSVMIYYLVSQREGGGAWRQDHACPRREDAGAGGIPLYPAGPARCVA